MGQSRDKINHLKEHDKSKTCPTVLYLYVVYDLNM